MKAKKENKSYKISSDLEKQRYLKEGYDIYDDDGKLLEYSPLKKIAYSEYAKLKVDAEALKAENELLRAQVAELAAVKQEAASGAAEEEKAVKKAQKTKAGA